jgi:hypothetical protein
VKKLALCLLSLVAVKNTQASYLSGLSELLECMTVLAASSCTTLLGALIGSSYGKDGAVAGAWAGFLTPFACVYGVKGWNKLRTETKAALAATPIAMLATAIACKISGAPVQNYVFEGALAGATISAAALGGIAVHDQFKLQQFKNVCGQLLCAVEHGEIAKTEELFKHLCTLVRNNEIGSHESASVFFHGFCFDARVAAKKLQNPAIRNSLLQLISDYAYVENLITRR